MKTTQTRSAQNYIEWEVNYNDTDSIATEKFSNEGQAEFESLFEGTSIHIGTLLDNFIERFRANKTSNHPSFIKMAGLAVFIYFIGHVLYSYSSKPIIEAGTTVQLASMTTASQMITKPVSVKKSKKSSRFHTAAPVSIKKMIPTNIEKYINRYKKVAQAEMKKYGIPASVSMAQAIIESKAGNSTLSIKNNNHFGMKCFSKKCTKGHCTNYGDDSHKDFFRKYNSAWESWRAHSKLLTGARYKDLQAYKHDFKKWANGLQKQGYATDKSYGEKLIEVINKYELYKLDEDITT